MAKIKIVETKKILIESQGLWGMYKPYSKTWAEKERKKPIPNYLTLKGVYNVITNTFGEFKFTLTQNSSAVILKVKSVEHLRVLRQTVEDMINEIEKISK